MAETYRPLRPGDAEDLGAIARDWQVVRQLGGWRWPPEEAQIRERSKPFEGDGFVWGICREDRIVGVIGVVGYDLGYMLNRDWHGQGIITRAARAAVATAFAAPDCARLTASVWHDNRASAHLLRKLGFAHFHTGYVNALARRVPTLSFDMRLTRTRWEALEVRDRMQ